MVNVLCFKLFQLLKVCILLVHVEKGLLGSLARSFAADPTFMPQIVAHVGVPTLVEWLGHVGMIAVYNSLHACSPIIQPFVDKMENPKQKFLWKRRMEAWKFGSGNDYIFDE
jgi:lycopene cyclase CruP